MPLSKKLFLFLDGSLKVQQALPLVSIPVYLSWGFEAWKSLAGVSEVPGGGHLLPTAVPEASSTSHLNTAVALILTVRFPGSGLTACWACVPGDMKGRRGKELEEYGRVGN